MTAVTRAVREQGFQPLECSIPVELTIDQYRAGKRDRPEDSRQAPRRSSWRRLTPAIRR